MSSKYINKVLIATLCTISMCFVSAYSQNATLSPYNRFAYGRINEKANIMSRSMGGVGTALRTNELPNPSNPATYSSVDSLTFMFDIAASLGVSFYRDGDERQISRLGNLDYITLQFPIMKRLGFGGGIAPFSEAGYRFGTRGKIGTSDLTYTQVFSGKGGFQEAYAGLSYFAFNRLAMGFNVSYLFGTITHERVVHYTSATSDIPSGLQRIRISHPIANLGVQYIQPFGDKKRFIIGGTYRPKYLIRTQIMNLIHNNKTSTTTVNEFEQAFDLNIPERIAVGVTYDQDHRLTLSAETILTRWSQSKPYDLSFTTKDQWKGMLGIQYIPNYLDRSIMNKIRYRAGASISNSYFDISNLGSYIRFGASAGMGIPLIDGRSFLNLSFEYERVIPSQTSMLRENFLKLTIGCTFNEMWFRRALIQ